MPERVKPMQPPRPKVFVYLGSVRRSRARPVCVFVGTEKRTSTASLRYTVVAMNAIPDYTTIPLDEWPPKWMFDDSGIRAEHLAQCQPMSPESAQRLWHQVLEFHDQFPFTKGWFGQVDSVCLPESGETEIRAVKKWLYERGIPFRTQVFLSYQPDEAIVTTWKMVVKYWDTFWWPMHDLTVIDGSMNWALLFWHEREAFFGHHRR